MAKFNPKRLTAKRARKLRHGIKLGRSNGVLGIFDGDAYRAAAVWFPTENPFCRMEYFAFIRAYYTAYDKRETS